MDINCLPDLALEKIFEYFSPVDKLSTAKVCKSWYFLTRNEWLKQKILNFYINNRMLLNR